MVIVFSFWAYPVAKSCLSATSWSLPLCYSSGFLESARLIQLPILANSSECSALHFQQLPGHSHCGGCRRILKTAGLIQLPRKFRPFGLRCTPSNFQVVAFAVVVAGFREPAGLIQLPIPAHFSYCPATQHLQTPLGHLWAPFSAQFFTRDSCQPRGPLVGNCRGPNCGYLWGPPGNLCAPLDTFGAPLGTFSVPFFNPRQLPT